MNRDFTPKSRKDSLVVQELDGEVLIYDLQNDKAFCLNMTSATVWQACDGSRNVSDINDFVGEKLNSKSNEDLVWLALDQLKKEKLIENHSELNNRFEGMSRREVVKKVGLASVIALSIVASLVAPLAAHAVSGCPTAACTCPFVTGVGMTCTTPTCAPTAMCGCLVAVNAPGINPNPGSCN
jgi:hypothetical protein